MMRTESDILLEFEKERELSPELIEIIERTFDTKSELLPSRTLLDPYFKQLNVKNGSYLKSFYIREHYLKHCFVAYNHEFMKSLSILMKANGIESAVELCAGTGWLSHWMQKYGLDVKATDNKSWSKYKKSNNFLPLVKKQDAVKAVKANRKTKLFILSWPYMDEVATRIWKAMKPGQMLLYIGEGHGGCTASDSFFRAVEGHEKYLLGITELDDNFLRFSGIHDRPQLYRKP